MSYLHGVWEPVRCLVSNLGIDLIEKSYIYPFLVAIWVSPSDFGDHVNTNYLDINLSTTSLNSTTMVHEITVPKHKQQVIDIGDGLCMRWSTSADAENVAELVGDAFRVSERSKKLQPV